MKLKPCQIIIIWNLNKLGLLFYKRSLLHTFSNRDLNRNYPSENNIIPKCIISRKIIKLVNNSDFILDFHEGWGFAQIDKNSIGSGIYHSNTKLAKDISFKIIKSLNYFIKNEKKNLLQLITFLM